MRVLFETESGRQALAARIDAFHRSVRARVEVIAMTAHLGVDEATRHEEEFTRALGRVAPGLRVEILPFGSSEPPKPNEYVLVVSPDGDEGLESLADEVVRRATPHERVAFVRHGPPRPLDAALAEVRARTDFDFSTGAVRVGFSRGHLLEVVVYSPHCTAASDERALGAADLLVSRLLGDLVYYRWIGVVDVAPSPRGGSIRVLNESARANAPLPLAEFAPAVNAAIEKVRDGLPADRCCERYDREDWTLLELEAEPAEDYERLDDLALVSTLMPEAVKCLLQGSPFVSHRFSRFDERLLYVKIDAADDSAEERHARGLAVEDALNAELVPTGLGAVVGGGVGLRYVYVFVAADGLERCVTTIRERLRSLRVHERSWILFCDVGWEGEWVGVWENTPPP